MRIKETSLGGLPYIWGVFLTLCFKVSILELRGIFHRNKVINSGFLG